VLVMNLASDTERLAHINGEFSALPGFALRRVPGVAGETLPDAVCAALIGQPGHYARGTLGCFLSHVAAWEAVARLEADYAVVLEDDVTLLGFARLATLSLPADAGIVFINERLSPQWVHSPLEVLDLAPLLLRLDATRNGLGGDGYILRPAAARQLLAACRADLYGGHVDGRLLRLAVPPELLAALPEESWIRGVIEQHHDKSRMPQLGLLRGYTLSHGIVRHRGVASSRERGDSAALPEPINI
jgi:GR25 family glycosyltransferase involved in LPS biosynthesis